MHDHYTDIHIETDTGRGLRVLLYDYGFDDLLAFNPYLYGRCNFVAKNQHIDYAFPETDISVAIILISKKVICRSSVIDAGHFFTMGSRWGLRKLILHEIQ